MRLFVGTPYVPKPSISHRKIIRDLVERKAAKSGQNKHPPKTQLYYNEDQNRLKLPDYSKGKRVLKKHWICSRNSNNTTE